MGVYDHMQTDRARLFTSCVKITIGDDLLLDLYIGEAGFNTCAERDSEKQWFFVCSFLSYLHTILCPMIRLQYMTSHENYQNHPLNFSNLVS